MSKYTYKRDDTPDVSGCGFVLVLFLALHGFCMYLCFRGRIETRNKYIGHDPIDGWFCWNAHTHMYWRTMDKNGRIFTAYLVATLRNETDRDIQYCVVCLLVCVCVCDRATDHMDDDSRKIFECFCVFEHVESILFKRVRVGTAIV